MNGLFITFEGVEGCGKSTQLARLCAHLEALGHDVVMTREPGGTPIAEAIRNLLLDPANKAMTPTTELLLYEAARAQHVDERIRPALEAGKIVLCDRFADSTTAYQGAGRALPAAFVEDLHKAATRKTWPSLTIVLDVPSDVGLARAAQGGAHDRIEQEPLEFHERVRAGFLRIADAEPERVRVIDGCRGVDDVAADIASLVQSVLDKP